MHPSPKSKRDTIEGVGPRVEQIIDRAGARLLRLREPLAAYPALADDAFLVQAARAPDRIAIADTHGPAGAWREISHADLAAASARAARALAWRRHDPSRPVLLLSDNRIEAAQAILGAYRAGRVIAPVTPAYSRSGDPGRLRAVINLLQPSLAIVDDAARHGGALRHILGDDVPIVSFAEQPNAIGWEAFLDGAGDQDVDEARGRLTPDDTAKVMFTSGSTGAPKGVVTTHRMLASNQQAIAQSLPMPSDAPLVLFDWLPWSHTFGGSYVFGLALSQGGSLYIDRGQPAPGRMAPTLTGLRDIRPNVYFNVPRGLELLAAAFDEDPGLAADAFENLQTIFFAGAGLPERVRDQWLRLIDRHARQPVRLCSAWGMTETAPLATALGAPAAQANNIGIPAPGVDIKLAPIDGCYELRVRGPNVTPGYLAEAGSSALFDADGFFKTGDIARLADEADPDAGLLYEGRLSDNFKLTSGVWVNVAELRGQLLTVLGSPAQDVVLSGAGRTSLTALVVLDIEATRRLLGQDGDLGSLSRSDIVKNYLHARISIHNQTSQGLSRRISAFAIIDRALDARNGEITEKGSVNQKIVLRREAAACQSLHDHLEFKDGEFEMPNACLI